MNIKQAYRSLRQLKWFSPGCFVLCAVSFAAIYLALHLLGLREYTSVLCGTLPADRTQQTIVGFCGMSYLIFHMLAVAVAPILLIAAALFHFILLRAHDGDGRSQPTNSDEGGSAGAFGKHAADITAAAKACGSQS